MDRFVKRFVIFLILITFLCSDVMAIETQVFTHVNAVSATPITIWASAAIIGIVLFLLTLKSRTLTSELEADAIVSVVAWIPIAYTAITSFAVDRIISSFAVVNGTSYDILENHAVYQFGEIGVLFMVFFVIAIVNTVRIVSLHKTWKLQGRE